MNNHNYHGNSEPVECPACKSSMTETNSATSTWLQCDECDYQVREAKSLTEAEQYEADAKADHFSENQFNNKGNV